MARPRMVSRTIITTECELLAVSLTDNTSYKTTVVLAEKVTDKQIALKKIKKFFDNDEQVAVSVMATNTVETLYGMSEQEFIKSATKLDSETRKPIEQ